MNNWLPPPSRLILKANQLQLWMLDLDCFSSEVENLATCLSAEELQQAERFVTAQLSNSYIIAHAFLRRLLASYLNTAPQSLRILANPHGKPYLDPQYHPQLLEFNMSHTRGLAVYAFALAPVGIDVELLGRDMSFIEIAERFFTPTECSILASLAPAEQQAAFYRCWTLKEAFVKCLGEGLGYGLNKFEVDFMSDAGSCLKNIAGATTAASDYFLQNFACSADYVAAVALQAKCDELKFYNAKLLDSKP